MTRSEFHHAAWAEAQSLANEIHTKAIGIFDYFTDDERKELSADDDDFRPLMMAMVEFAAKAAINQTFNYWKFEDAFGRLTEAIERKRKAQ